MGELLISKGAAINARTNNDNDWTPLHFAAFHDSIKMGELLISEGADINASGTEIFLKRNLFKLKKNQTSSYCCSK